VTESGESVEQFLYREAALLDERRWDEWLRLYSADVVYWVPAWDSDSETTKDPNSEISLIYYDSRQGLEDRVFRIGTGQSSASIPFPRTCHFVSNIRAVSQSARGCDVKATWQVLLYQNQETFTFFGFYDLSLLKDSGSWLIKEKKITLLNDTIHTPVDVYCL
jgi:benzoate/toluate 1,2-dioxygenase beta subunit